MTRTPLHIRPALAAGAALILQACGAERVPTAPLGADAALAAIEAPAGGEHAPEANGRAPLFVDDGNQADCPQARFTSIQAAVETAEPGDRILVCRGTYPENVLVTTTDLRLEAQGAPGDVVLQGPGTGTYGFHLQGTSGVLVQGFTVRGYPDANIIIDQGSGNILRKNVTTAGIVDGIEVLRSSFNLIEHNISFANTAPNADGIFVSQGASTDNVIRHNETYGNGQHGINLFQSGPRNLVSDNRSHDNRGRGIQTTQGSHGTVIENNHAYANGLIPGGPLIQGGGIGILVVLSNDVTIRNNRTNDNGTGGIALNGSSNSVVSNNRSERNTTAGITLNGSGDNLVEKNNIIRNGLDGIRLTNEADRNVVRSNVVLWNARDGIRVFGAAPGGNTLELNRILHSTEHDARDDSVGGGTAGTANVWVRNHCDTGSPPALCG